MNKHSPADKPIEHLITLYYSSLFYTAVLCSEQTHCAHVACNSERVTASFSVILNEWQHLFHRAYFSYPRKWCTDGAIWLLMAGATWNCCVSGHVLCIPLNHAPLTLQCYFIQSPIVRVHVCLAVTCHLHFWQNDQDLSRATAVTRGWDGYRNKS